jgi:uncharacterized protein (DUF1330 family)
MEKVNIEREKTIQEIAGEIITKFGNTEIGRYKIQLMADEFAKEKSMQFIEFIEVNGFRRLAQSEEYSNAEIHRTRSELYEMFLCGWQG